MSIFFFEKSVISSLETEVEEKVNNLRVEINHTEESAGIEGRILSRKSCLQIGKAEAEPERIFSTGERQDAGWIFEMNHHGDPAIRVNSLTID